MAEVTRFDYCFRPENIVCDGCNIWYTTNHYSLVFMVSLETGLLDVIPLPHDYIDSGMSFRIINVWGDYLFLFPFKAKEILKICIKTGECKRISLPECVIEKYGMGGIIYCEKYNDSFLLYGYNPILLLFDVNKDTIEVVCDINILSGGCGYTPTCFGKGCVYGHTLVTNIHESNKVLFFDIEHKIGSIVVIEQLDEDCSVDYLTSAGKTLLFYINSKNTFNKYKCIGLWDVKTNELRIDDLQIDDIIEVRLPFYDIYVNNDDLWLMPCMCNRGVIYNLSTRRYEEIRGLPISQVSEISGLKEWERVNYYGVLKKDSQLIAIHIWTRQLVIVNMHTNTVNTKPIVITRKARSIIRYMDDKKMIINNFGRMAMENDKLLLQDLLTFLEMNK